MCYNCGCNMPKNPMGNDKNLVDKNFEEAAQAMGQSVGEAQQNTVNLLRKINGEIPSKITKVGEYDKYEDA